MVRFLLGDGIDERRWRGAGARDPARPTRILLTPTPIAIDVWGWTGRFGQALAALDERDPRPRERHACARGTCSSIRYLGVLELPPPAASVEEPLPV